MSASSSRSQGAGGGVRERPSDRSKLGPAVVQQLIKSMESRESRECDLAKHVRYHVLPYDVFTAFLTLPYGVTGLVIPGRDGGGGTN